MTMPTMKWFGENWHGAICDQCPQVRVPIGEICDWCEEPITARDRGVIYSNGPAAHLNCFLRQINGSVAHVLKTCSCYVPGASEDDPPELTRREAANLVVDILREKHEIK
jgi:hypothetical protein